MHPTRHHSLPLPLPPHMARAATAVLLLVAAAAFTVGPTAKAAAAIYDESADAPAQVADALADARRAQVPVLLVFGANWCGDCRVLDMAFHNAQTAALIERSFRLVKVDVGRFDRNTALAERYGVPLKKGIPAVAVVSPSGEVVYATRGGELADARRMGDAGIHDFFTRIAGPAR